MKQLYWFYMWDVITCYTMSYGVTCYTQDALFIKLYYCYSLGLYYEFQFYISPKHRID